MKFFIVILFCLIHNIISASWERANFGGIPIDALSAGFGSGLEVWACRGWHENELLPGKLHTKHQCCYVPWGGREHKKHDYEVVVGFGSWFRAENGSYPIDALEGGQTIHNETLYVCRTEFPFDYGAMMIITGKLHPSQGKCYIPYNGKEIGFVSYEVLVH